MIRHGGIFRPPSAVKHGLIFPQSSGTAGDGTAFLFTGAALLPHAPATYIFRVNYVQQAGYYTNFFYSENNGGAFASGESFYGCHPYPFPTNTDTGHHWEVSTDFQDIQSSDTVGYGTWYRQCIVVKEVSGVPTFDYYYDLDTGLGSVVHYAWLSGNTWHVNDPVLMFGDNPWPAEGSEALSGTLRGLQIYSTNLSTTNLLLESANDTSNAAVTSSGIANLWYINQNPTPSDISDKSGNGHNPSWQNAARPTLYTG